MNGFFSKRHPELLRRTALVIIAVVVFSVGSVYMAIMAAVIVGAFLALLLPIAALDWFLSGANNSRVVFWIGTGAKLPVDAIYMFTPESETPPELPRVRSGEGPRSEKESP